VFSANFKTSRTGLAERWVLTWLLGQQHTLAYEFLAWLVFLFVFLHTPALFFGQHQLHLWKGLSTPNRQHNNINPAKTDRIKHVASSEVVLIYTGKARCEWMHVTNAASVLARSTGMTCVHHRWLRSTAADAYSHFEKGNSGVRVACSGHMQLHTYASQNNHSWSKVLEPWTYRFLMLGCVLYTRLLTWPGVKLILAI
jgi:hypothetical protein